MSTIYDITGEKFFAPLASKNRHIYINVILYLHRIINELFEGNENNKVKIVEMLAEYLDDLAYLKIYSEDSENEIENKDSLSKAYFLINRLEECGWIVEESIGNGIVALDFNDFSYSFIKVINELIDNYKPQYTSYIRAIKNTITSFNYTKIEDLEIIDYNLSSFVVALRQLRSNIQRYYKNITKSKDQIDLGTLLDEFTGEYKEYFFDSAYLNLKIKDNVDSEIPRIIEQLDDIFENFLQMEKLINAKVDGKDFDYEKASIYVHDMSKRIMANIKTIPSIIEMIDTKNEKYVNRTVSVIIHLINRGEDIEGILHRLIDYVKEDKVSSEFVNFFDMKHYNFASLAKPKKYNPVPKPEMISMDLTVSETAIRETFDIFKSDKRYNVASINEFILEFMGEKKYKFASDLRLDNKHEFIMLICIIMYSRLPEVVYHVEVINEKKIKNGISFNDFIIKRRGE